MSKYQRIAAKVDAVRVSGILLVLAPLFLTKGNGVCRFDVCGRLGFCKDARRLCGCPLYAYSVWLGAEAFIFG